MTTENTGSTEPLDDAATFDAILSGEELPEIEAPKPQETEQPAPVEATTEAPAPEATEHQESEKPSIPPAAIVAERERRQAAERIAEQERREKAELLRMLEEIRNSKKPEPQPVPDFWEAPEDRVNVEIERRLAPIQQAMIAQQEYISRTLAAQQYGEEAVNAAYTEMEGRMRSRDPSAAFEYQRIMNSPNPYASLVEWHKKEAFLNNYGSDPEKVQEKLLSDPAFLAKALERAQQTARTSAPVVQMPNRTTSLPSVSKMGAAAPIGKGAEELSDDDLWEEAMNRSKRRG